MSIPLGQRCQSKRDFAEILRRWAVETDEETIGAVGTYGRRAWLWVTVNTYECHLNADTKRDAVQHYLHLVQLHGADLPWRIRPNRNGTINKVCVERDGSETPGFYLYVRPPLRRPAVT